MINEYHWRLHVQAGATLPAHLPPPPFSSSVRARPCSRPCLPRLPPPANDSLAAGVGEEERESRREGAMKNLSPPPSSSSSAQSISTQGLICYCKRKYLHIKSQMCAKLPTTSGDAHLGADDVLDAPPTHAASGGGVVGHLVRRLHRAPSGCIRAILGSGLTFD